MNYVDPVSKKEMQVKSVCIPAKTLLQGKQYTRANDVLVRTMVPRETNTNGKQ